MKILILLAVTLTTCKADTASSSSEEATKPLTKNANTITITQKPHTFYTIPIPQHQSPPYIQYIQKPHMYQQPQATMFIIAQPALVPQHLLLGQAAQQLLHYFHNNPQARYQFLHGGHYPQLSAHPTAQSYVPQVAQAAQATQTYSAAHYMHPPHTYATYATSPTIGSYLIAAPQQPYPTHANHADLQSAHDGSSHGGNYQSHRLRASPSVQATSVAAQAPINHAQATPQDNSQNSLKQIASYATAQAQRYAQQATSPIRSAPPIITGFENFSPEQQAQIKEQLSAHLGGGTLTQINGNSVQASTQLQFGNKYTNGQGDFTTEDKQEPQQASEQRQHQPQQQQQQQQQHPQLPQAQALTQSQSIYRNQYKRGSF